VRWINTEVGTLRAKEFIDSSVAARGTWFSVLGWCIEQENTGCIKDAASWTDRQWIMTCGVTLREVRAASLLLRWEGDDLFVLFYPVDKELEVQAKRLAGQAGGLASGKARSKQQRSTASSTACDSASTEGNGKEGNGKEDSSSRSPSSNGASLTLDLGSVPPEPNFQKKKKGGVAVPRDLGLVDDEHIAALKEIYRPSDVDKAVADMRGWLLTPRGRGKGFTKRRLGFFLRDAEPICGAAPAPQKKETPVRRMPEDWFALYVAEYGEEPPEGATWDRLPPHVQRAIFEAAEKKKAAG
jgi:hypothetical protein